MKDEKPMKRVVAVFTITVEMHIPEGSPAAEKAQETTQQTLSEVFKEREVKDDQTRADDEAHGWRVFKQSFGPERRARYPERKTHTCAQCGAPNRRNNPAKGGCVECRPSDIFTDQGGRIE